MNIGQIIRQSFIDAAIDTLRDAGKGYGPKAPNQGTKKPKKKKKKAKK